jgi:hypothetical protein
MAFECCPSGEKTWLLGCDDDVFGDKNNLSNGTFEQQ